MTDKIPQSKEEKPMNKPTTFTVTTDTAYDGGLKGRTLLQVDALKTRFKAGSIPLQTDFADLIDLANVGRQAVGGAEGQTGPANGFTLSPEGLLELKPNEDKGISVDSDGIAVKADVDKGLQVTSNGVGLNSSAWINTMCGLHNASFYAQSNILCAFFCNGTKGCVAHIYSRGIYCIKPVYLKLNSTVASEVLTMSGNVFSTATIAVWDSVLAAEGLYIGFYWLNATTRAGGISSSSLVVAP